MGWDGIGWDGIGWDEMGANSTYICQQDFHFLIFVIRMNFLTFVVFLASRTSNIFNVNRFKIFKTLITGRIFQILKAFHLQGLNNSPEVLDNLKKFY